MNNLSYYASTYIPHIVYGIFLLVIGWLVAGWIATLIIKRGQTSERFDETLMRVFGKTVKYLILGFVVIVVLRKFGIQTASLIAIIGGLAIGIGLAWKGVLKDFASGIMLLTMRPFKVGEAINFGKTWGVIEEIGVVVTKMHTFDNLDMTVPNSKIWGNVITNLSANDTRRADMEFRFGYNDNMDKAMDITREILEADERVLAEPEPLVAIHALENSSVTMRVRPWLKRTEYWPFRYDFTKRMKERFDEEGLNIPYPNRHDVRFFQEN